METLGDMICEARSLLDDEVDASTIGTNQFLLEEAAESQDESNLLWTTAELKRWANEAVDEVAIRSRCIRDSSDTADLTMFTVAASGTGTIAVPRAVIRLLRVTWNGRALTPTSKTKLDAITSDWQTSTAEEPTHFILDQGTRQLRVWPLNTIEGTLRLEVVRRPVTKMVNLTDEPEIPADMLGDAVYWMLHKAYLKNDADTKDNNQSATYEELFTRAFGPKPSHLELEFEFHSQSVTPRQRVEWI